MIFVDRERGRAVLFGGLFTDHALAGAGIFYVNLPIGAVGRALVAVAPHVPARKGEARDDYPGAALLGGALDLPLLFHDLGRRGVRLGLG